MNTRPVIRTAKKQDNIRLPPQNLGAERGLLGSILLWNDVIDEINTRSEEFYSDQHRVIYESIQKLWKGGVRAIDAITLGNELGRIGKLEFVGGVPYLMEILESVPHAAHARVYANIVREKAKARQGIYLCTDMLQRFYAADEPDEVFAELMAKVVQQEETAGGDLPTIADALRELEEYENNPRAVGSTGFTDLDKCLNGGFHQGQTIVVAARPGHGKSVLGCQFGRVFAARGEPVLIISLEMTKREIAHRYRQIKSADELRKLPIFFEDVAVNSQRIAARIRYAHRRYGIRIAVLDYLQLVEPDDRKAQRERQVAEVSRAMKLLARELKIPIVIACQLNRSSEKENRMPRLSDLRESGSLEQDADVVLMLQDNDEDESRRRSSVIVAKNRGGRCGSLEGQFDRPNFVFRWIGFPVPETGSL